MLIDNKLMDDLLEKAITNVRKRVNFDLRDSDDDNSQRMLNALQPGSFIDIHRHPNTSETLVVLRGAVTEIFYDEKGVECERYELSVADGNIGLQIPAGTWHTLIPREPSVIIEVKDGKYDPLLGTDIWTRE
ncbi:MAG: WbuC family cupin fold metalloprotein [Parabacteroides sp.]|nr:WbuC family cupin fold metalloprotein [Parabacteroides sp.]